MADGLPAHRLDGKALYDLARAHSKAGMSQYSNRSLSASPAVCFKQLITFKRFMQFSEPYLKLGNGHHIPHVYMIELTKHKWFVLVYPRFAVIKK